MWLIEKYEKENPRLKDVIERVKNLVCGAKQYDRLAASVYSILDEVKDIVGEGIEKLEEREDNRVQRIQDACTKADKLMEEFAEEFGKPLLMRIFPSVRREIEELEEEKERPGGVAKE